MTDPVEQLRSQLAAERYFADEGLLTAVHLALSLGRPLALEGEPGVGKTEIAKVLALHNVYEVGKAINPAMAKQQIEGGAWMGISHALYEATEPYYPNRDHGPRDFEEYLMPGPADNCEN